MPNKMTNEVFLSKLQKHNPSIQVLDEYTGIRKPIRAVCKIHNLTFETVPLNLLRNKFSCRLCANEYIGECIRLTNDEFVKKLSESSPSVIALESYDPGRKMLFEYAICHNRWKKKAHDILTKKSKCRKCVLKERAAENTLTQEQFVSKVIENNLCSDTFEIIGTYHGTRNNIECRCKICGHIWHPYANSLIRSNVSCPVCNLSKGEAQIKKFLDENAIKYEMQKSFDGLFGVNGGLLRFDFYLPSDNLLIEYQGQFHDGSVSYQTEEQFSRLKEHDLRKKIYAKENYINLLEIWYFDKDRLEDILKDSILIK